MSLFFLLLLFAATRARLSAPDPTLLLRDRHGAFLGEVSDSRDAEFGYWPLQTLPPRVVAATLAIEDRRFWHHPGVDPLAVARTLWHSVRDGHRTSGGSTIAMQVARMQHPGPRTYFRKVIEALTASMLTVRCGRAAVLAHYLRIVPYGNRIHGIAYAARRYLNKPVDDLSWAETALLVAIPQAPSRMHPYTATGRARAVQRARRILGALLDQRALSPDEHDLAVRQLATLRIPPLARRPLSAIHAVLHLQELLRGFATQPALPSQGLIDTTIDLDIQNTMAEMTATAASALEDRGVGNAAAIVLDRSSNQVRAWVGSTNYFDSRHAGAYDYARLLRSPGSTLKPFLYALALERGRITPATILDDIQRTPGDIVNADEAFLGPLLPRVALANSRNVPAANLLALAGLDDGYAFLRDLGLHDGDQRAQQYGLGLSIGALPVTLERLVRAYTVLADDGRLSDLLWYQGQPQSAARQLLSEETARQVTLFLSDPMARLPTFPRMSASEYPFPVAVKTGTSSKYRDTLTVAYSTRYVVGVWMGHPDYRPMNRLTAFRSAASLAQEMLTALHRDERSGLDDLQFPPPRGFRPVRICALTGKRAAAACAHVFLEWFRPGQEPIESCDAHVQLAIDTRNGLLASSFTPPELIEVRRYAVLSPRYAAWAAAAGLPRPPTAVSTLGLTLSPLPLADERGSGSAPRRPATDRPPQVHIVAPASGIRLVRDPEIPAAMATVALRAVVDPPAEQIVWYVDNVPFQVVDYPYTARWTLKPGAHTFQARLPFASIASASVHVNVQ